MGMHRGETNTNSIIAHRSTTERPKWNPLKGAIGQLGFTVGVQALVRKTVPLNDYRFCEWMKEWMNEFNCIRSQQFQERAFGYEKVVDMTHRCAENCWMSALQNGNKTPMPSFYCDLAHEGWLLQGEVHLALAFVLFLFGYLFIEKYHGFTVSALQHFDSSFLVRLGQTCMKWFSEYKATTWSVASTVIGVNGLGVIDCGGAKGSGPPTSICPPLLSK